MFNTLEDMKHDDQAAAPARERWLRNGIVLLIALVLFGGLYAGVQFLD